MSNEKAILEYYKNQQSYKLNTNYKLNSPLKKLNLIDYSLNYGPTNLSIIRDECLFEIFEKTVDLYPNNAAIEFEDILYSYTQIDNYANKMARYLKKQGISKASTVAILLPRSVDSYVSIVAISKAGGVFVPLDINYPEHRVKYIIDDSNISITITTSDIAKKFSLTNKVILLDKEKDIIYSLSNLRLNRQDTHISSNDLCYIIYTSGSSGKPKGVQIEHKSICHYIRASQAIYNMTPNDRVYQGLSLTFDAALEEVWLAFAHGAILIPATMEMQTSGPDLGKLLYEKFITVFNCVPTLLSLISDDIPSLRLLILGGESCPHHLVEKWDRQNRKIINTYGPTETTIVATFKVMNANEKVTIGRPLANYSVFVLSENNTIAKINEPGELLIGGIGLARGYVNRDDLNKEKFINNMRIVGYKLPERLYRTGDLVRFNSDGDLEFLGRIDSQIKLRGFRIELSEIESVIDSIDGVQTSVVSVFDTPQGIQVLAAYIVPKKEIANLDISNIFDTLKGMLPQYMMPQSIQFIDSIPMLSSGKADRNNLPSPKTFIRSINIEDLPKTDLEKKIAECWKNAFKIDIVSIHDHFFNDLGGHSLFAATVVSELRKYPEMENLNFSDIYQHPTIEKLVKKVNSNKHNNKSKTPHNHGEDFLHSSPYKYTICGISQMLCFYAACILLSIPVISVFYMFFSSPFDLMTVRNITIATIIITLGYFPAVLSLSIIAKWTIIGKFKAGKYPLWGSYYLRWWIVRLLQSLFPIYLLAGTPLMPIYLRLMGANVGKNCFIGTHHINAFDLLTIGDDASIGLDCQLLGYTVEDGYLILGNIEVANKCYTGTHSVISINTKILEGSMLLEQSMLSANTIIPPFECWSGSPASKDDVIDEDIIEMINTSSSTSLKRRILFGISHLIAMYVFELIPLVAMTPISTVLYLLYLDYNIWCLAFSPFAAALFVIIMCLEIIIIKRLTLGKVKHGVYSIYSSFYLKKWIVDQLMYMSLSVLHTLYATLYTPTFLKFMGAKIGKRVEISTVTHISPDLLFIDNESFLADASMAGTPKIYMNQTKVSETKIGSRTFIGNSALVPINKTIGDNCLIGVLSVPPKSSTVKSDTSWLGSPAIFLHKRDINKCFSLEETYSPTKLLYAKRFTLEFFRVILPITMAIFLLISSIIILRYFDTYFSFIHTLFIFPLIVIGGEIFSVIILIILKIILFGKYKPITKPLWSTFVWKTELLTGLYESVTVPFLLAFLRGTPFISWILRLFGCKIGKRTFIDTTFFSEFDLVEVGDEVALNYNSTMQTHLFEDRVMKMSNLRIGNYCSVGSGSVVLYDTIMEDGTKLGSLSLLMKGETLPSWSNWEGNPAGIR